MTWLIQLLIEGIREQCSQFIVDSMDLFTNLFTELLSCDLSLFEELFSIVGSLYGNVILPLSVALLLMIFIWQLFKSLFGRVGLNSEDPIELTFRSAACLFMAVGAKQMVNYILRIAGTPYNWVVGTDITVASFSEYSSALELVMSALAIDSISISLITLIMQFVVAWNYFKMLLTVAERYVLLGVLSYTAPLAFATGGSKVTNNILSSWCRLYGGQVILVILDAWCMKMFLAGYGNMIASGYGFTKFFAATMCLLGFCKIVFKLDSYMASLGVSLGRTSGGMGGMGFLMAASRLLSHFGGGSFESSGNSGGTDGGDTPGTGGGSLMPGGGGNGVSYPDAFSPIPLSAADGETGNAGETEPPVFGGSEPEPETQGSTESGLSENSENVFSYETGQEFSESAFSYGTGQDFSSRIAAEQSEFESGVSDGGNGINAVSQDDDFGADNMAEGIPMSFGDRNGPETQQTSTDVGNLIDSASNTEAGEFENVGNGTFTGSPAEMPKEDTGEVGKYQDAMKRAAGVPAERMLDGMSSDVQDRSVADSGLMAGNVLEEAAGMEGAAEWITQQGVSGGTGLDAAGVSPGGAGQNLQERLLEGQDLAGANLQNEIPEAFSGEAAVANGIPDWKEAAGDGGTSIQKGMAAQSGKEPVMELGYPGVFSNSYVGQPVSDSPEPALPASNSGGGQLCGESQMMSAARIVSGVPYERNSVADDDLKGAGVWGADMGYEEKAPEVDLSRAAVISDGDGYFQTDGEAYGSSMMQTGELQGKSLNEASRIQGETLQNGTSGSEPYAAGAGLGNTSATTLEEPSENISGMADAIENRDSSGMDFETTFRNPFEVDFSANTSSVGFREAVGNQELMGSDSSFIDGTFSDGKNGMQAVSQSRSAENVQAASQSGFSESVQGAGQMRYQGDMREVFQTGDQAAAQRANQVEYEENVQEPSQLGYQKGIQNAPHISPMTGIQNTIPSDMSGRQQEVIFTDMSGGQQSAIPSHMSGMQQDIILPEVSDGGKDVISSGTFERGRDASFSDFSGERKVADSAVSYERTPLVGQNPDQPMQKVQQSSWSGTVQNSRNTFGPSDSLQTSDRAVSFEFSGGILKELPEELRARAVRAGEDAREDAGWDLENLDESEADFYGFHAVDRQGVD